MQPKTRVITAPVLLGLSVLSCLVLYQFASLTPSNAPLPAWVISSMAEARSTGRPEGPVPVAAVVAAQTAPALEPPTVSQPSPDLTTMPSKEAATGASETKGGAQSPPALLSRAAPDVSSDIASPKPEEAQLAHIEADRQAAAAADREAQVEDHLQGARLREAQRASVAFELERRAEAERLAAERRRALQAAAEAAAAEQARLAQIEADRQAAAEREAQVEDRLQGARLREAQRASAGFELERQAKAERLASERRRALQAAAEAAAEKKAQLAQVEADRQAAAEKKAAAGREAQVEDRLQGARLREAERASAGFELARRAEAERLAAERRRALQAASEAAAAKQAQLAQIEADRQAAAAAERAAPGEDGFQRGRPRGPPRTTAGFELERRAEAERVAAERRRALQAASEAAAAEQQLAQIEADRQAAAEKKAAAEREAQVEDRLQGARLREAERASAGFELERRAEAEQTTTGSISRSDARSEIRMAGRSAADDERGQFQRLSDGRHASKNAQPGSNDFAGLGGPAKRTRRTIAPSANLDRKGVPRAGDRQRSASEGDDQGASSGASITAPSVVATLSESGGPRSRRILQHRCASILQDSDEYDDDLVSLCRTWGAGDRAAAR